MKNTIVLPAIASVLFFAGCSKAPAPAMPTAPDTTAADTAAVRFNAEQFVAAWNISDSAAIAPLFAEDAILMRPDGPAAVGRAAIVQDLAKGYDPETMVQTFTNDEIILSGDYAYARGTWNLDPRPGVEAAPMHGKWTTLYKRSADGAWQSYRWMYNRDRGESPAGG